MMGRWYQGELEISRLRVAIVVAVLVVAAGCGSTPGGAVDQFQIPGGDLVDGTSLNGSDALDGGLSDSPLSLDVDLPAPNDAADLSDGSPVADSSTATDTDVAGIDADGVQTGPAQCPVKSMTERYSGFLPTNPYGPVESATTCVAQSHDVIILLGCPNNANGAPAECQIKRADLAVQLMKAGYGSRFITSGAAVKNQYVEAETLRDLLLARGVPGDTIWLEPKAEHTDENIYYSSKIMAAQGWLTAVVVSDDAGHLMNTAVCDSNCCVKLGRLTLFEFTSAAGVAKAGHYVLYPATPDVGDAECQQIRLPTKLMCLNLDKRRACKGNLKLPPD